MQINPDDINRTKSSPLELFYQTIRADATKLDYDRKLRKLMCEILGPVLKGDPELVRKASEKPQPKRRGLKKSFCDADFEVRINQFVDLAKKDPDYVEDLILTIAEKFAQRTKLPRSDSDYISATSLKNYFIPVQRLLEMSKVTISWRRIKSSIPKPEDLQGTRGYSREEIQTMLEFCDPRDRVLVLLAASSGIRAGAFTLLWKHLIPIYHYDGTYFWEEDTITEDVTRNGQLVAVMIRVYANSSDEYVGFATPECWNSIQAYRKIWIQDTNHEPQPDDPFFKQAGPLVKPLSPMGLRKRLERVLNESGIRKPLATRTKRYDIPAFNGFRRFFNKENKKSLSNNSILASLILKETMMGHTGLIQLDKNYFKSHIDELIDEYLKSVPNLTISNENKQQLEIEKLRQEKTEAENYKEIVMEMQKELVQQRYDHNMLKAQMGKSITVDLKKLEEQEPYRNPNSLAW